MLSWPWTRRPWRRSRLARLSGRGGIASSAAGAARILSVATFCAAEVPGTSEEGLCVTIPAELEAKILRFHHVEKWRIGTIAKQLRVHHETVERVLGRRSAARRSIPICRSCAIRWLSSRP